MRTQRSQNGYHSVEQIEANPAATKWLPFCGTFRVILRPKGTRVDLPVCRFTRQEDLGLAAQIALESVVAMSHQWFGATELSWIRIDLLYGVHVG